MDVETAADRTFTEEIWNSSSSLTRQPYSFSKTVAERAAWKLVEQQDRWDLVVVNPGFVFGPSLSSRIDGTSTDMICSMLNGKFKTGVADLRIPLEVDTGTGDNWKQAH